MSKNIEYSISNIEDLKNNFDKYNSLISENLSKIEKEYLNITDVLSTPNSNVIVPELYNLVKKYNDIVTSNGISFNKSLDTAIKEYSEFVNQLKETVRGDK